jgi:hypothetical protein
MMRYYNNIVIPWFRLTTVREMVSYTYTYEGFPIVCSYNL